VGLAICRKIALRHNGEITATSQPGKGSTFILLLPIKQTKALPTAEPTWERTTKK
jgi:signal transduction histidine kinase